MVKWVFLGVLVVVAGIRYWWIVSRPMEYGVGDTVRVVGVIRDEPRIKYDKQYIMLSGIEIELPGEIILNYGDKVEVVGTLEERVIRGRVVGFRLMYQSFSKIDETRDLAYSMGKLRTWLEDNLEAWLPGDEGGLAVGILLGGSGKLSWEAREAFRRVGLTHVLAASGYNVTIISVWMMAFWEWIVGRKRAIWFGMVSIVVYMLLAGMGTPVIRAGIMAMAILLGKFWGREADGGWILVLTAVGMLIWNPLWISDIGFQLSVAAMGGLVWLAPALFTSPPSPLLNSGEGGPRRVGEVLRRFGEDFKITLAAQIATMPIILHHFGNLSVISPIVNAALLWMVPLVMQVTAVGTVIGPVNWAAWPLLRAMLWVVGSVGRWEWASFEVGRMTWSWVMVYYLALGVWIYRRQYLKS